MEFINEYICLKTSKDKTIFETVCLATENTTSINLSYTLLNNDCLFDFSNVANKVEIIINKTYFEKYAQEFELVIEKQQICCNTQAKLFDLVNCNLNGISRNVFLESLILYLLFQIQKNNLVFQLNCDSCSFLNKPIELEKIQKAKDFILNHIDETITIPIIASHVGTNQCYLKKGFKEITGQTIFEFLQENRMVKAKHILQNTSHAIQEVASLVGYASLSSFSQTYKNYFGITPSLEQKKSITNN